MNHYNLIHMRHQHAPELQNSQIDTERHVLKKYDILCSWDTEWTCIGSFSLADMEGLLINFMESHLNDRLDPPFWALCSCTFRHYPWTQDIFRAGRNWEVVYFNALYYK